MDVVRGRDENIKQYKIRLCKNRVQYDLTWQDVADLMNKELGCNCHRDRYRKWFETWIEGYSDGVSEGDSQELVREIDDKTKEMQKERVKLQDQRREYLKIVREEARWENLRDLILEKVDNINKTSPLLDTRKDIYESRKDRQAILCLSDWHYGIVIDNAVNKYNPDIAKERINILTNKTIEYCKSNNVSKLWINLQGDLLSGIIHTSLRLENTENIIEQVINTSEIISNMIGILSNFIPHINVSYTWGNHGRTVSSKHDSIEKENFELLLPWYLETRLKFINNVSIIKSKYEEIIHYNVLGFNVMGVHGHNDRVNSVIHNLTKITKIIPDIVLLGHLHKDFRDEDGATVIINGSLSGIDSYALSKRYVSSPHQKLLIIEEGVGEICTYKIGFVERN